MSTADEAATLRRDAQRDRDQADLVLVHAERLAADFRLRADRSEADADRIDGGHHPDKVQS